ncbi:MAG: hypothetical protein ACKVPZ_09380 [Burkholderiaceae bacterium]
MSNIRTLSIYRDIKDGLPATTEKAAASMRAYNEFRIRHKEAMNDRDGIPNKVHADYVAPPSPETIAKLPFPRMKLVT